MYYSKTTLISFHNRGPNPTGLTSAFLCVWKHWFGNIDKWEGHSINPEIPSWGIWSFWQSYHLQMSWPKQVENCPVKNSFHQTSASFPAVRDCYLKQALIGTWADNPSASFTGKCQSMWGCWAARREKNPNNNRGGDTHTQNQKGSDTQRHITHSLSQNINLALDALQDQQATHWLQWKVCFSIPGH